MDPFKVPTLSDYLGARKTNYSTRLPLVHSSEAWAIWNILRDRKISVSSCDTFTSDQLAYFFLGRPSYRKAYSSPQEWQLPVVLIFKSTCLLNIKRVFPFDSGAFLGGKYPSYISEFEHDGYNIAAVSNAVDLLVETFFGDDSNYFHGHAYSGEQLKRHANLTPRHHQIYALCALYNGQDCKADDRSRTVEFQTESDVPIDDQLLGCVLPRPYFDDDSIKAVLKSQGVVVKHYDIYPLSIESYMGLIYAEVKAIYKKVGVFDGR